MDQLRSQVYFLGMAIRIRDPTNFLDPERNRIRNLNCRFELLIFITFVAFKTKFDLHSIFHAYFRLG